MKRTFEFLFFLASAPETGTAAATAIAAEAAPVTGKQSSRATASGVRQGARAGERQTALKALAASLNLKVHDRDSLRGPTADTVAFVIEWPIEKIGRDAVILIAGAPTADELASACKTLKGRGNDIIIVVDALSDLSALMPTLKTLNEQAVEMVVTGAVKMLVTGNHLMVYRFPKADSTTTIAVFADIDQDDPLVLTMVRGHEPFKGMESFPGGFLNVQLESLPECAARELMEECFVNDEAKGEDDRFTYQVPASEMTLIDVRSDPDRDERGHVVDHGYAWFIGKDKQESVMSALNAGDDAQAGSARFVRASTLSGDLAFDHKELFVKALSRLKLMQAGRAAH